MTPDLFSLISLYQPRESKEWGQRGRPSAKYPAHYFLPVVSTGTERQHVLLAVSRAFSERWEGHLEGDWLHIPCKLLEATSPLVPLAYHQCQGSPVQKVILRAQGGVQLRVRVQAAGGKLPDAP